MKSRKVYLSDNELFKLCTSLVTLAEYYNKVLKDSVIKGAIFDKDDIQDEFDSALDLHEKLQSILHDRLK